MKKKAVQRFLCLALIAVMLLTAIPLSAIAAQVSSDPVLATIRPGEILEFRNTGNRNVTLRFEGDSSTAIDFSRYGRNGDGYLGGAAELNSRPRNNTVPAGGMLVAEHRGGGNITVRGDGEHIRITRLQTPALYTRVMWLGSEEEFLQGGPGRHTITWRQGYGAGGIRWSVIRPDGTTGASTGADHGGGINTLPGTQITLRGVNRSNSRLGWWTNVWGSFTAFSGQPYRLTIDGQRSFPPGVEENVPPPLPTAQLNEIAGFSFDAREMFNMLLRTRNTRYERPFAEYSHAVNRVDGRQSNNNARMVDAYHRALIAMLNGEENTHGEAIANMGAHAIRRGASFTGAVVGGAVGAFFFNAPGAAGGKYVGGQVGGAIGRFITGPPSIPVLSRELVHAGDDVTLLFALFNNTTDPNLRAAIVLVLQDPHYRGAVYRIVAEMLHAFGVHEVHSPAHAMSMFGALGEIEGFEIFGTISSIYTLGSMVVTDRRQTSDAADRVFALQGIRAAAWGAYSEIVSAGWRNNEFTEENLLKARHLFMFMSYLSHEQVGWSNHVQRAFLGNPGHRDHDARLDRESREMGTMPTPMWYPYSFSSRLPTRNQELMNNLTRIEGATVASHNPSAWARTYVREAIAHGIVPQNLQSHYTRNTTRAEFAALAVAFYEAQHGLITGRSTFVDTNDVNVQKAAYIGVVEGVGNNRFAPNNPLTREQAAVMLSRLANVMEQPLPSQPVDFVDSAAMSSWSVMAIGQMQATGIMGGVGNNRFSPGGAYTREQSIVTMMRLLDFGGANRPS